MSVVIVWFLQEDLKDTLRRVAVQILAAED